MRRIFIVAVVLLPGMNLVAQTEDATEYQNHIGFNTAIIINNLFNGEATPFTLMYKRQTSEKRAWRFGVGMAVSQNNEEPDANFPGFFSVSSYVEADISLGHEWVSPLSQRWYWYKGADVFFRYYQSQIETYDDGTPYTSSDDTTVGGSINPFLGIRFNVNNRLYLSTEVSLRAGYYQVESTIEDFNQATVSNSSGTQTLVTLQPATGIFIFYRF